MKRFTILMIGIFLLVGYSSAVWAGGQKEAPEEAPEAAPVVEQVTLVFSDWHLTEPHWEKALKEAFVIFERDNPNIKIELDAVSYGEKETKYTTEIEAGVGSDVFHLHAYSIRSFIEKGYVLDMTRFINAEGSGFINSWYDQTVELMKKEGRYFAMPGDFMSMVLYYNKSLYSEAGLDPGAPPRTWDQFLEYAKKLTRDRSGDGMTDSWGFGTIGAIAPGFELRFTPVLFSHGGSYLTEDNKGSVLNSAEAKEALKFFTDLVTVHKVIPPGVTAQNPGDGKHLPVFFK